MQFTCPTCASEVDIASAPQRKPTHNANEAWVCLKCDSTVCVDCYHAHTAERHPEVLKEIKKRRK